MNWFQGRVLHPQVREFQEFEVYSSLCPTPRNHDSVQQQQQQQIY
jgi:hypothetical protein